MSEQKAILNNELVGIVTVRDRRIVWANPAFEHMLGFNSGELEGTLTRQNYPSDEAFRSFGEAAYPVLAAGKVFRTQMEHIRKDGQHIWVDVSGEMLDQQSGQSLWGFIDITERVLSAAKIDTLMREQKAILNNELVGIMTAKDRVIGWANPAFEKLFGYECGELVGQPVRFGYCSDEAYEAFGRDAYPVISEGKSYRAEQECQRKDGSRFFADVSGSMLSPTTGETLWCFIDVTDRKRNEQEIKQLAFYDTLTGLPNRRLLLDRLTRVMAASKRSGRYAAVLFLDLDNFKPVNDEYGHDVGDLMLIEAAARLTHCVREIDTVARFGGDEFVVMLSDLNAGREESRLQAHAIAEKIRATLSEPYQLTVKHSGKSDVTVTHHCTASIGVALFSDHEVTEEGVLKWADTAMYRAKDAGRNAIRFHEG
jgi:diguanylate cyclase (GGDEF)-like protein/PAS domain S-box-containing protein